MNTNYAQKSNCDNHHGDDININFTALHVHEMQSEEYHIFFYIKELVEYIVDSVVCHHGEESLLNYHDEESVVIYHEDKSIVNHSGHALNGVIKHFEDSNGVCTKTFSENCIKVNENLSTCHADTNIIPSEIGESQKSCFKHIDNTKDSINLSGILN